MHSIIHIITRKTPAIQQNMNFSTIRIDLVSTQ